MKLTSLLISILVFLMSGVMCLFSTKDVYAQVPQTKRSEQDSFLKNIRAKKRNNDLQKARRAKGRSNQKNGNKIRFRFISGQYKSNKLKGKEGKEIDEINSLNIFYNSIGVGFTNIKNKGCKGNANSGVYTYCENTLTDKPYQRGEVNLISLLYNFGNNLFFSIGVDLYASGYLIILDGETGNEIEMKNPKASSDGPRILQLGFKLYNLEIFFENKASIISFKKPDSGNDTINTSDSILFGVGIVF